MKAKHPKGVTEKIKRGIFIIHTQHQSCYHKLAHHGYPPNNSDFLQAERKELYYGKISPQDKQNRWQNVPGFSMYSLKLKGLLEYIVSLTPVVVLKSSVSLEVVLKNSNAVSFIWTGHRTHFWRRFPMKSWRPTRAKTARAKTVKTMTSPIFFTDWIKAATIVFRPEKTQVRVLLMVTQLCNNKNTSRYLVFTWPTYAFIYSVPSHNWTQTETTRRPSLCKSKLWTKSLHDLVRAPCTCLEMSVSYLHT